MMNRFLIIFNLFKIYNIIYCKFAIWLIVEIKISYDHLYNVKTQSADNHYTVAFKTERIHEIRFIQIHNH